MFDLPRQAAQGGSAEGLISAALIDNGDWGATGNPDGDYLWDTASGYAMSNTVFNNLMEYIGPDGPLGLRGFPRKAQSSAASHDVGIARKLWQVSEELTGVQYAFK